MFKFLKGVVGSAGGGIKDLPYNLGEPYATSWGSWTHCRGTSKEDNSPVSIFSFTSTGLQDGRLAPARNGVKRLRTVRHPNVLSFLHSTEAEGMEAGTAKVTIYVVTEPVIPLSEKLKELNLSGTQREEYFAWGLHQISKAVSFLNNDCKLVHGNICLSAVVVTPTLDWKLHAFDVLAEFDGTNPDATGPMLQYEWLVGSQYKALEYSKGDWAAIRKSPPWALDAWGLGCLIYELFSNTSLSKTEELRNTAPIPKNLLPDYQRLLSSVPTRRLNPSKLIENSEFFHNRLVETIQFMEILNLKDSVEKDTFFRKLSTLIDQLPRQIVLKKLLPLLASALEFGSASAAALNPFLKMGSWLSQEELTSKVVPTIVKLFASTDRAIRVGLLQNVDQFGSALPSQLVDEQVFLHLATGFSDTSALLRELTLKSMLTLAPKLSQRTLTGSLLKHLSKLQVDEEPGIRTNTTILLGNIAGLLNDATRKRVLINAFTVRALRDNFAPARGAGIMALTATSQYYDAGEIATRILPSLVVLTIDPDSDVRIKAFEATDTFLQLVRKFSERRDNGVTTSDSAGILPVATSGLLGWAVGSLITKTADQPNQVATGTISESSLSSSGLESVSSGTIQVARQNESESQRQADVSTSGDYWDSIEDQKAEDERDGWDDMDDAAPAASLSRIQAAQQRPIATPASSQQNGPTFAEADFVEMTVTKQASKPQTDEDDPWADIAAPPPTTKAKPLSHTTTTSTTTRGARAGQHVSLGAVGLGGSGRGRGRSSGTSAPMKLGAQRVSRPPS